MAATQDSDFFLLLKKFTPLRCYIPPQSPHIACYVVFWTLAATPTATAIFILVLHHLLAVAPCPLHAKCLFPLSTCIITSQLHNWNSWCRLGPWPGPHLFWVDQGSNVPQTQQGHGAMDCLDPSIMWGGKTRRSITLHSSIWFTRVGSTFLNYQSKCAYRK